MSLLSAYDATSPVAWDPDRPSSAAQLAEHTAGFATLLEPATDGDAVLVICRDRYRFAVAVLAAWSRGYSVALPPNAQRETIRALRPAVRTVVHDVEGIDRGIDVNDARVIAAARAGIAAEPLAEPAADRQLATVFTSGSSGASTACAKTAGQLLGEARALAALFEVDHTDRFAPMVPPHHIYGLLFGVLVPIVAGASFHRRTPLHIAEVMATLNAGATCLVSVPAHLRALSSADPELAPALRRVFSSGAPLSPAVATSLQERLDWTITEVFGSSETGGIGWRQSGGEGPWLPLPGVDVDADADGRMLLRSPFVHPDAERPYVGADRIERLEGGRFRHLGRADGVVKVGGVRVSVAEVEQRLLGIDGVRDAAVLAVHVGGPRQHELWAAVVTERSVAELRAWLRHWLAPVAMPRRFRRLEALPRTAAGKVSRTALEEAFS